jgi:hypothetical protein
VATIPTRKPSIKKAASKKAAPKKPAPQKAAPAKAALKPIRGVFKTTKASEAKKPPFNEETMQVLRDANAGKNLVRFQNLDELFEDLDI